MKFNRASSDTFFAAFLQKKSASVCTILFILLVSIRGVKAQTNLWSSAPLTQNLSKTEHVPDLPDLKKGVLLQLDIPGMQNLGKTAQKEFSGTRTATTILDLPLPDGSFQKFRIWESPLMEPELAAKFPEIKTYILKGIDDPFASGRMSVSPDEFGAFFTSKQFGQEVYIRKALKNSASIYLSYWGKEDPSLQQPFNCLWEGTTKPSRAEPENLKPGPNETGDVLRVFRLAMTIPGKLSEGYGWTTKAQAMASLVAFLGTLNTIFERDLSVRFVLPAKQDEIIFVSSANDPFTALGGGEAANENLAVTNQLIGQDGFDVGLIFVTGACCAAGKPTICGEYKAYNFSAFWSLRVTAHEIGHQFDANHTWTSCGPSNNGQFGTNEYGSGTSIMSYANICGIDNILPVGDENYFGVYSQIEMTNHINAQTCYKTLETGNHIPTSSVPADGFYIPISTPFELVGSASDVDGDDLTYSWEQVNIRNIDFTASTISIQTPPAPSDGNVPIARIFNPSSSPRRTIPQLSDLLSNTTSVNERLPTYSRNIKYRMYVRDNHLGAGGTTHQQVSFEVDGAAGPFLVSNPNTCVTWQAGSSQTITWEVANTNNVLVNCQKVKISLSLDGGYNYPYVLAANTPNDGSETITLPAGICSNKSRIKIEAEGNIFFDISNADFNIETNGTPVVKANALRLDGIDDQVEIQNENLGNFGSGEFTIEMWVQTTDNNCAIIGKRPICNCDNFWNFFIDQGRLRAEFSTSNTCSGYLNNTGTNNTLANGSWHHIAFVRQGTTLRFYVDGILDLSVFSNQNFNNPAKITLGNIVCGGQNFSGSMDEIRIWNISRTAAEINDKMNCTLLGNEAGLQAYYPVSSQDCGVCSAGTNAFTDITANGNHGLMQNGANASLSTLNITDCPNCANGPIAINTEPANQSVSIGSTATFTLMASGNNLSYQWYLSTNGGATFSEIAGATEHTYSFTVATSGQNGWLFKCYVSNGCDLKSSVPANLTLPCPTQTLSGITGPAAPCVDNYYTYFVTPNPNIASWSWTTPAGWSVVNFGNMIFVKPAVAAGNVSVTGTDACGNQTAAQIFVVAPVLVSITSQPVSQTVTEGTFIQFSIVVANGGGPTTYVWQESIDGGATYSNIPGANAAMFDIPSATISQDQRKFRCIASNACLSDTSEVATLGVNCSAAAPAVPTEISGGTLICPNASLTYSIAPVAGANSYLWTLPSGWTGSSNSTSIAVTANGTGGSLKVQAINLCGSSDDQTLPIAINPNPCRRGVHFDGENDHLSIGQNGQALSGDLSISFWIKPDLFQGEQTLIFNGREFIISLSNSQIRYKHSDDCCGYDNTVDMIFSGNLEPGKWTNVAITRETANRTVHFYLNGNFVQSQTYGGSSAQPGDNTTDMILGAGKNGAWANFKGSLDEIRIWSVIRSMDELKQDLVCNPGGNEFGLKANYDFESGQPYGDNAGVADFTNLASAYGVASVRNMAMNGTTSNIISGDLPSYLFQDLDGDGFGGAIVGCNYTGPTVTNSSDCDDQNSSVNPNTLEICNGIDDDCSGIVDDLPNVIPGTNLPVPIPAGQTITSTLVVNSPTTALVDLNVLNLNISHIWIADLTVMLKSPQGTEITLLQSICGDQDDVLINFDDESTADYGTFPCPPTNNGTYKPLSPLSAFDGENPNGTWTLTVIDVYEDAGVLNDWSIGFPSPPQTLYADLDGDGFGDPASSIQACTATAGYVTDATDCNDSNNQIHPGATEICNNVDDDCDGSIDEGVGSVWYADADGDGYGNAPTSVQACTQPSGYVPNAIDCNDSNSAIYPNALEIVNGLDDDCDGMVDDSINVSTSEQLFDGIGNKNAGEIQFALRPNPADDVLNIVFAGVEMAIGRVEIFNPIGQRILTQEIRVQAGVAEVMQIGKFPQGNYMLIFRGEDGKISGKRFVILRDLKR
jgi:subtilisin-like proprotein convertase family protein